MVGKDRVSWIIVRRRIHGDGRWKRVPWKQCFQIQLKKSQFWVALTKKVGGFWKGWRWESQNLRICVRKQLFFFCCLLDWQTDRRIGGGVLVAKNVGCVELCDPRNIGCVPWGGNGLASRRGEVERLPRNQELLAHTDCKHFRAHRQNSSSQNEDISFRTSGWS